ncbi:putative adenylyl cyclase class-4 guanylyl cyclase [Halocaridina rubra]|uniref:adenylate cyclase n=1 Tax=Halocaridina rubra TaxID=373956 RepID=A0AAN8WZR0_HALRR
MVAAGLHPGKEEARDRTEHCLVLLVDFALALASVLDSINKESFQNFKLRVGLSHGPVIAGVVGAQKPQYDIWGNTVNVASRMDSTGLMGRIQVTEETAAILSSAGWSCECRGPRHIKGKGTLITYFVSTPYDPPLSELRSVSSSYSLRPDEGALIRQPVTVTTTNDSNTAIPPVGNLGTRQPSVENQIEDIKPSLCTRPTAIQGLSDEDALPLSSADINSQDEKTVVPPRRVNITMKTSVSQTQMAKFTEMNSNTLSVMENGINTIIPIANDINNSSGEEMVIPKSSENVNNGVDKITSTHSNTPVIPCDKKSSEFAKPKLRKHVTIDTCEQIIYSDSDSLPDQSVNVESNRLSCPSIGIGAQGNSYVSKKIISCSSPPHKVEHVNQAETQTEKTLKNNASISGVCKSKLRNSKPGNNIMTSYVLVDTRDFTESHNDCLYMSQNTAEELNNRLPENTDTVRSNCDIVKSLTDTSISAKQKNGTQSEDVFYSQRESSNRRTDCSWDESNKHPVPTSSNKSSVLKLSRVKSVDTYSPLEVTQKKITDQRRISMVNFVNGTDSTVTEGIVERNSEKDSSISSKKQDSIANTVVGIKSNMFSSSSLLGKKNQVFV